MIRQAYSIQSTSTGSAEIQNPFPQSHGVTNNHLVSIIRRTPDDAAVFEIQLNKQHFKNPNPRTVTI